MVPDLANGSRNARLDAMRLIAVLVCLVLFAVPTARAGQDLGAALARLGIDQPIPRSGKAILVNIPGFELVALENGREVFRSRVIVGTAWHRTPIRPATVSAVRFRPTWRPTPSMIASGEYPDRVWPPGERNPLGLAAVRLDPGFLVYLHDTNRRDLFDGEMRALSHGCVRVAATGRSSWPSCSTGPPTRCARRQAPARRATSPPRRSR